MQQSFITSNQRKQQTNILEETYAEGAMVQEQVAQEIIIRGRKITHIAAGPYDGYLEGPLQTNCYSWNWYDYEWYLENSILWNIYALYYTSTIKFEPSR